MKKLLSFLLISWLAIGFSSAQQDCEHAIDLTVGTQQCGTNNYLDPDGSFPDDDNDSDPIYNRCNDRYNDGEYWFKYVGNGSRLKLDVSQLSDTYSGLFVFDDCPMDGNCIAGKATSSDNDYSVTTPPLSTGHTYYIVIANYGSPDYTDFCLDATEIPLDTAYTCGDVFYDTGGESGDYGSDEDYWVKICSGSVQLVELDFELWDAEDNDDDKMVIYDGDGVSSGVLAYGDEDMPLNTVQMTDTNSSHCLVVHWVSDGSYQYDGWKANVKCFCGCQYLEAKLVSASEPIDADGHINICGEKEITLTAGGDYQENDQCYHQRDEGSIFVWDFGDKTYKDTGRVMTHTFAADSGFFVDIKVIDTIGCESTNASIYSVRSSIPPTFDGTKPGSDEICLGSCTRLIPESQTYGFEQYLPEPDIDTVPLPDGDNVYYYSEIDFNHYFYPEATLTDVSQIDSLLMNIEHSYIGDLIVWVVCPNGTEVLLFDGNNQDAGASTYLGVPGDDDGNKDIIGDGWNYAFADWATEEFEAAGTVKVDTKNGDHTDHNSIKPGTYNPTGNFSDLIGCPLNGVWKLKINDDQGSDNGYLMYWNIWFADSLYYGMIKYDMAVDDSIWSGPADLNHPDDGTQSEACPTTLGEKNYIYTVTDNFGCEYDTTIKITVTGIEFDLDSTMVTCNGENDGEAKATVTSGDVKEYKWTYADGTTGNIETTDNSKTWTGLKPGIFTVTVVNTTGCETVESVVITEPDVLKVTEDHEDIDCHGDGDGSITLTVSGGTVSYTYDWDGDGFDDPKDLSSLDGGDYNVTIKDAHGCEVSSGIIKIDEPSALSSNETHVNVKCHGSDEGSIDLSVSGGISGYTYKWTGPNGYTSTDEDLFSLKAGDYDVTVKDAHDCELLPNTITITEPDTLKVTEIHEDVKCYDGFDGSIDISVSGGTGPYEYSWSNTGSYAANTEDISDLEADTYEVEVEDDNHCIFTLSNIQITEPSDIIMDTVSTTHSDCGGKGGTADLTVSGGSPGYTYSWSDLNGGSSSDEDLTDVAAGNYRLLVTDIHGCKDSLDVSITDNGAPTSSLSDTTHNKCYGDATGSVKIIVSGGTTPYTYAWNTGATGDELENLPAGTYSVEVTDGANCKTGQTFTVKQPTELKASLVSVDSVLCHGDPTGKITISVTQGTPSYHYSWTGPNGYTSSDPNITDAEVGTYTVVVTDDSTCQVTINDIEVKEPEALNITYSIDSVKCYGEKTGSIDVTVTGGVKSYIYKWYGDESTTSEDLLNVGKGTYNFLVTDIHGCQDSVKALKVEEPDVLQITYTVDSVICHGDATGNINLQVTGGVKDYYYDWDNDGFDDNDSLLFIKKGSYTLQIKDHNACTKDTTVVVEEPVDFSNSVITENANCGANDGKITVTASGSNGYYTYAWYGPDGARFDSSATFFNDTLMSGSYTVVVIDKKACRDTLKPTIAENGAGTVAAILSSAITCHSYSDASVKAVMNGGAYDYTYYWILGTDTVYKEVSPETKDSVETLKAGTYKIVVVDANNCRSETSITVTEPDTLESSYTKKDLVCFNDQKGEANVTNITGGTNPYSVKWYDAKGNLVSINTDAKELPAGTYSFIVTDSNNCTYAGSVNLNEPAVLKLESEVKTKPNGGDLLTEVSGGTAPYSYEWSNGAEDSVLLDQIAGQYIITVTDAHGCIQKDTLVIEVPLQIPTIISPNGDGKNDTWRILGIEAYADIHIEIYNRWGNIVFEYTGTGENYGDAINRFNGYSTDGEELPLGSYVYILDLVNENRNYSGVVTVIKQKQ